MMDSDKGRHTTPLGVPRPYQMSRPLRGCHEHIDRGLRHDLSKVDVETMGKCQIGPLLQIRADLLPVQVPLELIRRQNHHHISELYGISDLEDLKPGLLCLPPRSPISETDEDIGPCLPEVIRMGMSLAPDRKSTRLNSSHSQI